MDTASEADPSNKTSTQIQDALNRVRRAGGKIYSVESLKSALTLSGHASDITFGQTCFQLVPKTGPTTLPLCLVPASTVEAARLVAGGADLVDTKTGESLVDRDHRATQWNEPGQQVLQHTAVLPPAFAEEWESRVPYQEERETALDPESYDRRLPTATRMTNHVAFASRFAPGSTVVQIPVTRSSAMDEMDGRYRSRDEESGMNSTTFFSAPNTEDAEADDGERLRQQQQLEWELSQQAAHHMLNKSVFCEADELPDALEWIDQHSQWTLRSDNDADQDFSVIALRPSLGPGSRINYPVSAIEPQKARTALKGASLASVLTLFDKARLSLNRSRGSPDTLAVSSSATGNDDKVVTEARLVWPDRQ